MECIITNVQGLRQFERRSFARTLLRSDYKPDEFKFPQGDQIRQNEALQIHAAFQKSKSVLNCPISTGECGNSDFRSQMRVESLGKCAVVASGSSILRYEYGSEIDSMDTVFRIGFGPVLKFMTHVGSRTDVMFVRIRKDYFNNSKAIEHDYTGLLFKAKEHLPKKFFLSIPACCQKNEHMGKIIMKLKLLSHDAGNKIPQCQTSDERRFTSWYENFGAADEFDEAARGFVDRLLKYRRMQATTVMQRKYKNIVFTHGFELIIALLHSKLCTHITTYGFSKFPTYHYFDLPSKNVGRRVRPGHVMGMEYFILEQLKETGLPITIKAGS